MSVRQKIQANPMTTVAVTIAAIAAGITGTWAGIDTLDQLHVTEFELAEYDKTAHPVSDKQFGDLEDRLDVAEIVGKCRWLSDKIDRLRYQLYILERDNASPDFIQSKQQELMNEERVFTALRCAANLS